MDGIDHDTWQKMSRSNRLLKIGNWMGLIVLTASTFAWSATLADMRKRCETAESRIEIIDQAREDLEKSIKEATDMHKAGYDPDEFDRCKYYEDHYHRWLVTTSSGVDGPEQVGIWYALVQTYPMDMRKAARKELGIK